MKKRVLVVVVVAFAIWWIAAAPRSEIGCCIADSIVIDPATAEATAAVDRSNEFAASLESFDLDNPAYDDAIFPDGGSTALVTGHDGRIWRVDVAADIAEPVADVPLMAWGIHEVPGDPNRAYFCSAGSYELRQEGERAGLYQLDLDSGKVTALAIRVPNTEIQLDSPIVYADSDASAPTLISDGSGAPSLSLTHT